MPFLNFLLLCFYILYPFYKPKDIRAVKRPKLALKIWRPGLRVLLLVVLPWCWRTFTTSGHRSRKQALETTEPLSSVSGNWTDGAPDMARHEV